MQKPSPIPDQNGQSVYPFLDRRKNHAPTYMKRGYLSCLYGLYKEVQWNLDITNLYITKFSV